MPAVYRTASSRIEESYFQRGNKISLQNERNLIEGPIRRRRLNFYKCPITKAKRKVFLLFVSFDLKGNDIHRIARIGISPFVAFNLVVAKVLVVREHAARGLTKVERFENFRCVET